jgi:LacI family transcriptional regulator
MEMSVKSLMEKKEPGSSRPASITEVARVSGASVATVSRVMNDRPYVGKEISQRVREVAARLNYRPNVSGRSLRGGKNFNIGILQTYFSVPDSLYRDTMLTGLINNITLERYGISLECLQKSEDGQLPWPELVTAKKVDGLVIVGHLAQEEIRQAVQWDLPTALVNNHFDHPNFCSAGLDDYNGAREIIRYLAALGHHKIGFVHGSLEWPATHGRFQGYVDTMKELGLEVASESVVKVHDDQQNYQGGYLATGKLVREVPELTAILYVNDWYAVGGICAVRALGKRIPEDISLAGFDNSWVGREVFPPLTTVSLEAAEVCQVAVNSLVRLIEKKKISQSHIPIRPRLIVRDSCARRRIYN